MNDYATIIKANLPAREVPGLGGLQLHLAAPSSGLSRLPLDTPYFAFAWAGGLALAAHFQRNPAAIAGRKLLDFGAGSGVVGIAAALNGAEVTCAETDPAAVDAIRLNALLNRVELKVISDDLTDGPAPTVDVVAGGDIFYSPHVAARVLPFLERCLAGGAEVLVGDPGRTDLPRVWLQPVASYEVCDVGSGSRTVASTVYSLRSTSHLAGRTPKML